MQELGVDHLWLDLRPVGRERLERQFPTILGRCRDLGLKPTEAPIPVAPAAHYWMGGVGTDLSSATSVPGLYAVGEVACTGVHGANRLASNSLMECLVFARRLADLQPQPVPTQPAHEPCHPLVPGAGNAQQVDPERLQQSIIELRQLCWQVAGVERQGSSLRRALGRIRGQRQELENLNLWRRGAELAPGNRFELDPRQLQNLALLHELRQRLVLAQLLVEAAGFRQESRGGHFRTDAPATQPFWRRETVQAKDQAIRTRPLPEATGVPAGAEQGGAQKLLEPL
jgi:L-aspartate oxidase